MIEGSLARRYSRALFQLAKESGAEELVGIEVEQFTAAYTGSELQQILSNPAVGLDTRKRIINQVVQAQQLSPLTSKFLGLLLERDRLGYLAGIASSYRRLVNQAKGRVDAKVVSANALEPATVARVRDQLRSLSGKEVVLQEQVDPSLLGGLLVELEGRVYDGTVRTQLEKMKQRVARGY